jgi:hypothetical protein
MAVVWLRTNTRAHWLSMIPPAVVGLAGLGLAWPDWGENRWLNLVGWVIAVISFVSVVALAWRLRRPRLAYEDGRLLVFLRHGPPIGVPIDAIDCFLLGQGPTLLPGHHDAKTLNVIVRLSETAADWAQREVAPELGSWCDGQIIVRGTWCEPLDVELVKRLNTQLAQATRQLRLERQP